MTSGNIKTNLYGFLAVFFLATSFPFSRIALEQFSPYALGFLRCALAAIIFIIIGKYNKISVPHRPFDILLFFLSGATGFGAYLFLFNKGMQTVTSATSSIITATSPIMTACAAALLYNEKISKLGILSITAAFCGVLVIILWSGILSINIGVLWTFAATVLTTAYNLLNRTLSRMKYNSIEIVTYGMFFGALLLAPFSVQGIHEMMQADPKHLGTLFFLSFATSGLGYFFLTKGMQIAEKTTDITNYLFAGPLIATILGYVILGETLNSGTLIGGILIVIGIVLFIYKGAVQKE